MAPLLKSYAKVEKLSISELNDFVLTAASQDIDFICSGKVTGVKLDKGWCYVSCSKCFKKLHRSVSTLTCQSCNNTNAVGVLRYRVEMSIADSTGEALFVAFDGVMAKLSTSWLVMVSTPKKLTLPRSFETWREGHSHSR